MLARFGVLWLLVIFLMGSALARDSFKDLRVTVRAMPVKKALASDMLGKRIERLYKADCFPTIQVVSRSRYDESRAPYDKVRAMKKILRGTCGCIASNRDFHHLLIRYYHMTNKGKKGVKETRENKEKSDKFFAEKFYPVLYACMTKDHMGDSLSVIMSKYFERSCVKQFDSKKLFHFYVKKVVNNRGPEFLEKHKKKVCSCLVKQPDFAHNLNQYIVSSYQIRFSHVPARTLIKDRMNYDKATFRAYGRCIGILKKMKIDDSPFKKH